MRSPYSPHAASLYGALVRVGSLPQTLEMENITTSGPVLIQPNTLTYTHTHSHADGSLVL